MSKSRLPAITFVLVPCLVVGGIAIIKWRNPTADSRTQVLEPSDTTAAVSSSVKVDPALRPAMDLPTLPGLEENRFDAVVRDVAKREDPVLDGWDTERLNELAVKQLKAIGKMLSDADSIDDAHLDGVAAENISTSGVRPAESELQTSYADKSVTVRRVAAESADANTSPRYRQYSGFAKALRHQAALVESLGDKRFKFKIVRVNRNADSFTTRSYFQISGRDQASSAQANSIWNVRWISGGVGELPKLVHIDVENYEEIIVKAPAGGLFADCTESVFRNSDRFGRQLVYGIDHWTDRFDGAIARPAAGHGIAVGDVNNDGLDDVYLCQSPGLPNLLLIQNADGTVTDRAVEAGVNWLEGTRAALLADLDNDGDQDLVCRARFESRNSSERWQRQLSIEVNCRCCQQSFSNQRDRLRPRPRSRSVHLWLYVERRCEH